ncbi:MAG: FAD-binding oxidoreductase [Chloroflexi bacterium]|nr:FAD-binding oxidoreductase [Chloroflexota bacterium]
MTTTTLQEQLTDIAGRDVVEIAPAAEVDGVRAHLAVAPGTPDEVARVLLAAREAGASVTPWGGGTSQRIGTPPERLDLILRTSRLNRILEWEPADLTACVEAGATLGEVQAALARRGQQIPIDAPCADTATLGGLVAADIAGPRRWQYGGWRDLVIGMHMALADGTLIKSGGRVVKNVQGYDLSKLFTGSLGSLGVIVQVNVKLVPLPAATRLLVGRGGLAEVTRFLEEVAASTVRASTIDLLDESTAAQCGLGRGGYAGLVLLEGPRAVIDAQAMVVERLAQRAGVHPTAVEEDTLAGVTRAWHDLARTDDLGPGEALLTVHTLPSEVENVIAEVLHAAAGFSVGARCWARAGNGVVYARLETEPARAVVALAGVQDALLRHRPATTLTSGDPEVERAAMPWGVEAEGIGVMRALKQRFDPTRTLQPGRFVGGI